MGQKITALHIDARGYIVKVRALSKSRRGSTFTLYQATAERQGAKKEDLEAAVAEAIGAALNQEH